MVTAKELREELRLLTTQRDNAFLAYQQAIGAIAVTEHLLRKFAPEDAYDSLTLDQLKDALGAQSAEIIEAGNG